MKTPVKTSLALLLATTVFAVGHAAADDASDTRTQKLEQQIGTLAQQLQQLQTELSAVKTQNEALAAQQQQQAVMAQSAAPASSSGGGLSDKLSLWGYGEINYSRPVHQPQDTKADLARAVFGIGYKFDDRTVFNSEFEIEHAVASQDDVGESEVEQFFVDHQFAPWGTVRAGLFLMPFGLLNERHEPTNYYGVNRNFVETLIIPSTWREGGVSLHGDTDSGFGWNVGLTTGFDLTKFNQNFIDGSATALDLADASPLQMTHQELSKANAQNLSQYVSLNYSGVPGLLIGTAAFTGQTSWDHNADTPTVPDQRLLLWEAHMRWTPGKADISALYAHGSISHTAEFNQLNSGVNNSMPAEFEGYYAQAAYRVWEHGSYALSPFVRWEHYNMGSKYEGIADGITPVDPSFSGQQRDDVWTVGANFYLNPNVVVKADYQNFKNNTSFDRVDLGLGLNF